ncbi:hypothetical protein C8J56DRAFT_244157 [Mycena floridula]|nr:hypothetical protein C8J56DRAFT_244157 [Mycena floridula]
MTPPEHQTQTDGQAVPWGTGALAFVVSFYLDRLAIIEIRSAYIHILTIILFFILCGVSFVVKGISVGSTWFDERNKVDGK